LIETFVAKGVREYDLLHVIPFGRAYTDGKEVLFYDLAEMQPYLQAAFAWARSPTCTSGSTGSRRRTARASRI
jgi:hypothetical protein